MFSVLSEFLAVYLNSLLELTVMNSAQGLLLDLKLEALFLFTYLVKKSEHSVTSSVAPTEKK